MKLPPGTYWITRDSDRDGVALDVCDVWTALPTRYVCEVNEVGVHSAFWMMAEFDLSNRVGDATHTLASVHAYFGVVPDDDRMCVRAEIG